MTESTRVDIERISATQRAAELAERQLAEEKEREKERINRRERLKVQISDTLDLKKDMLDLHLTRLPR